MEKRVSPEQRFERLVKRILEESSFQVEFLEGTADRGFDFLATLGGQSVWAIEVKFYRTKRAQPFLLEAALRRLAAATSERSIGGLALVVSCVLADELRQVLEGRYGVAIVDRDELLRIASRSPALIQELEVLVELDPIDTPTVLSINRAFWERDSTPLASGKEVIDIQGTLLCKELMSIVPGRGAWHEHEKICERILEYLFPSDLTGWRKQQTTDDGLSRFDLICRVRPATEFWKFVIEHMFTRYVIFEFKNYSHQIGQGQILSTEKYLLERAFRRVAIILTRRGQDTNALRMTQGAMRESGKLILVLEDKDICKMLHMRERGDDPTDYLFQTTDDFLMSLPR